MEIRAAQYHTSQHLEDNQLHAPSTICPFCDGNQRNKVMELQLDPSVWLLKCSKCKAISSSRMPTEKVLSEYYSKYYESPHNINSGERITSDSSLRAGRHLADAFKNILDTSYIKILDFGGGDGAISLNLAKYLISAGVDKIEIVVVDYNETTVSSKDNRITITHKDTLNDIQDTYDIIIASAVLEHIPYPKDIFIQLLNLLTDNGIIYARTPFMVPLMKLASLFGCKIDFTFPGHLHDLGQEFWETFLDKILRNENMQILKSQPSFVETSFSKHFLRTLAAYLFKMPWHILGRRYPMVGGWEIFAQKKST